MLDNKTIRTIEDFVYSKPRSIQEIAKHIGKNWRTADRYIHQIEKEFGTITTRTFREGTRGALKIVYWASVEKVSNSVFQEELEKQIILAKKKEDFSSFDIFQHISEKRKKVTIEEREGDNIDELKKRLMTTKKQLLIFSGNLSFINLKNKKIDVLGELEELVKKGVSIKVLCRVDLIGKDNVEKLLSLNYKYGKELVEIRHAEQPLRAIIYDESLATIKEVKEPTGRINELNKKVFIYYGFKDREWINWLRRIFWKIFSKSVDSHKRLQEIDKIF
ncbi:MAG: hypothetical protein KJI71_05025 [Patescibacteria group bacterium]|nr:hypothetical protein [Patescibacteria group bacterium]